jgi:L-ornithine Nalpha-acyltransferase
MIPVHRQGFTLRLAASLVDMKAVQRLRYKVFFEELSAVPSEEARALRLDRDRFDAPSDQLLVIQNDVAGDDGTGVDGGRLVGTYRLLRQDVARGHGGFYTQDEFDLAPLLERHSHLRFLEVGRSCVAEGFRNKPVAELLWQGIWNYVRHHKLDVMLGCASLPGTDPDAIADELTFLAHASPAPRDWHVEAIASRRIAMRRKPIEQVDRKAVLRKLPTLVKAYLRLGCFIGDCAVIDHAFNTTDVLIVLPVSAINPRYFEHYGAPDQVPTS